MAETLRGLRQRAGLPLRRLSVVCNYSAATLSNAASGKALPRWEVVEAYARGCSATPVDLQRLRMLWERAAGSGESSAAAEDKRPSPNSGERVRPARTPSRTEDDPSGARRSWRPRKPHTGPELSFADAVSSPDEASGRPHGAHGGSAPQHAGPARPGVKLRDPGDSLSGVVQQAHMISSSNHPALQYCSTPKHFIDLMEKLRTTSGLSLRDLSDQCKRYGYAVSKSTLHDLLNGRELPSTELLHAFLHACGCDPNDWMAWHQTRTRLKIAQLLNHRQEPRPVRMLARDRFTRTAALSLFMLILIGAQVVFTLTT
ncbi:helix-turn-helix transcriptional regulator [Streptomyces sp. f51]|uniref:helix-turn-helix transcriptional regulator n=1 Tax=Streptomyces sp. f51 TaxID=1827742 RepID=UPI0011808DA0|nr:helix-turn-helix transcriptional regulator [Streptomyces sp. f51]